MRAWWARLPGPPLAKGVGLVVVVVVALIGLFVLFEWAGDLLDSGGVVGPAP